MPLRKTPLVTGEFYHVFNRSLEGFPIFKRSGNADIFMEMMVYYTQLSPPVRFSYYKRQKDKYKLDLKKRLVTVVAYCLMPNHFHFLLKQENDEGIKVFVQKLANAFSHYYNKKNNRKGPLFESAFKSVLVESEEQLVHLSRYIHLNPVTDYLVESPLDYPLSSCKSFVENSHKLPFDPSVVMAGFKDGKDYWDFLMSRKDYQRELDEIKRLILE